MIFSDKILQAFYDYGLIGIIAILLGIYIVKLQKEHKEERKEWKEQSSTQFDTIVEVTKENTNAVSGLKATMDTFIAYNKGDK